MKEKTFLDPRSLALVILGGFAGTLLRYALSLVLVPAFLPWGTLAANILGCFVMGYMSKHHVEYQLLWGTGFCGALTTMSAFAVENSHTIMNHNYLSAMFYMSISIIGGIIACALGDKMHNKLHEDKAHKA